MSFVCWPMVDSSLCSRSSRITCKTMKKTFDENPTLQLSP